MVVIGRWVGGVGAGVGDDVGDEYARGCAHESGYDAEI